MRLWLVALGLALVLAGLLIAALGVLTWLAFVGGLALLGVGLISESERKAQHKTR